MTRENRLAAIQIDVFKPSDVTHWSRYLNVDEVSLRKAVVHVGPSFPAVNEFLQFKIKVRKR
jgi:hypothetical protein